MTFMKHAYVILCIDELADMLFPTKGDNVHLRLNNSWITFYKD